MKIYLSCTMTSAYEKGEDYYAERCKLYKDITTKLRERGFDVYNPCENISLSDFNNTSHLFAKEVFNTNVEEMQDSDFLLAIVDIASFGIGMELMGMFILEKPIILLTNDLGCNNAFVNGIPTIIGKHNYRYESVIDSIVKDIETFMGKPLDTEIIP